MVSIRRIVRPLRKVDPVMNANWHKKIAAATCFAALFALTCCLIARADEAKDENALINVIKSDAGWLEKQTACRALRQTGTAKAVPALAALLPNPELSSLARLALESMPYPEAGGALRDALASTQGLCKAGVIVSLGVRRDAAAVPALISSLRDPNADIARAAAGALGRIATKRAAMTLLSFRAEAPDFLRAAVDDSLLAAAQTLTKEGDNGTAVALCETLLDPSLPLSLQIGAFKGLIEAAPAAAPNRLIAALDGPEPIFRDIAAECIADSAGPNATALYARALPSLSPQGQIALLEGLAGRKDPVACQAVAQAAEHPDRMVRLAAVKALGVLGGAREAKHLIEVLASGDADLAAAAKAALPIMTPEDVNGVIADNVCRVSPPVRAALLEILAGRHAPQTASVAVECLKDADAPVRAAALQALAITGGTDQLAAIIQVLADTAGANERTEAEKALAAVSGRNAEAALEALLAASTSAKAELRMAVFRVLAGLGGPKALETIQAGAKDAEPAVADEAVRLLAAWPAPEAVAPLLALAQGDNPNWKLAGLRGYCRLAGTGGFSVEDHAAMLTQAMGLAARPEEKMIVLSAWGAFPSLASLDALLPQLDDASVQNEASVAVIAVAAELVKQDAANKPRAVEVLQAVVAKCADPDVKARAESTLAGLS